jgi:hypothetical protein
MSIKEKMKGIFKPRLKLVRGTRATSFLFVATSIVIAAGILWAANMYYNIDTGEVVVEEIQRVANVLRATTGLIVGGTATQNPSSGYVFEVVGQSKLATTTIGTGQVEFPGSDTYAGFKAPSSYGTTTPMVYILPQHGNYPPQTDYVLTWQAGGQLLWKAVSGVAGVGDITAVGDCLTGDCFTETGTAGTALWFYDAQGRGKLTIEDLTAAREYKLPDVSGTIALGTSTAGYVAYWTGTNTLAGTSTLPTSMGGTGANSSAWNGMVKVVGGTWSATQGTANYAAYWSDANTVAAEQYLAVSRGGTGAGSFTQYGILYGNGTGALGVTTAGNTYQLLTANTGAAPTWRNIADLITATNGVTTTGTTQLTLKLGGTLAENTTISLNNYNLLFNLTSGGTSEKFAVQVDGSDILTVGDNGVIYFKTNYPLAQTGKQVLREMVPVFGFDLPVKTATTSYVQISRTIVNYPLNPCESGASRVHKLVIRYGATATSTWQVATSTGGYTELTVPPTGATSTGSVYTIQTDIPTPSGSCTGWNQGTETDDWWVRMKLNDTGEIMIYQIFLAGYDQIL